MITRDYHLLRDDLAAMLPDRSTPIILMKANVCLLLECRLTEDGFNVRNNGRVVYFPSTGRQKDFQRQFSEILKNGEKWRPEAPRQEAPANEVGNAVLTTGKNILATGKDILDYVIKEHGEEILKYSAKVVHTAFQHNLRVMMTSDQHNELAMITADEMADDAGVDRKMFRQALRSQDFSWHTHGERWEVEVGGTEHQAMLDVLTTLT